METKWGYLNKIGLFWNTSNGKIIFTVASLCEQGRKTSSNSFTINLVFWKLLVARFE